MSDKLPIAETFHSVKGEGLWTGTPMKFIRLAGCNVGRYVTGKGGVSNFLEEPPSLPWTGKPATRCRTYDNRSFWCDTDYRCKERLTPEQLLWDVYEHRICITGGEPLMHNIDALIELAFKREIKVHIETNGTIPLPSWATRAWVAVSPKSGALPEVLERASEIKIVVDKDFDYDKLTTTLTCVLNHGLVWLMPIDPTLRPETFSYGKWPNLALCLDLLRDHSNWRLCVQMHKLIGVK